MSKQKFAFDKTNFILLAVGMAVVILGFILMTGPVSTPTHFEPDIFMIFGLFSFENHPVLCLVMIVISVLTQKYRVYILKTFRIWSRDGCGSSWHWAG